MSYTAPYIDAAGLHIPSYADILADLIGQARSIFGADIYLENDAPDYQLLSIFALKMSDTLQMLQLVYNNRAPSTSIGAALDSIVKINAISRKIPSYSTCQVTLSGIAASVINNGVVADVTGLLWSLPPVVIIQAGGTVEATATCQTLGAISANIGTLTTINTPTAGWISVTNLVVAVPGQPVEPDSLLRSRQAISTMLPSKTLFDGTIAAIAAVPGVVRSHVSENFTNITDADGLDPHSIWAIVEGGTDQDVAEAIYYNKSVGCGVNGTTSVVVTDEEYGTSATIKFSRPSYVTIYVNMDVRLLAGGTSANLAAIQNAVENYLNSLQIGESVTISGLYGAAMATMPNLLAPVFSITSLLANDTPSPSGTTDITIAFNEVAQATTSPASVVVNEVV